MFFKKKKAAAPAATTTPENMEIMKTLRELLAAAPRVEGKEATLCLRKNGNYPGTSLRELGPTLREDLGGDGKVLLYYNTDESKLVLMLTFCYGQGSAEMELIAECIDDMNIGEEDPLPGDISHVHTVYIEGRELSEVNFISENVKKKDLRMAADRLLDRVFDWLDILYEAFEDEF